MGKLKQMYTDLVRKFNGGANTAPEKMDEVSDAIVNELAKRGFIQMENSDSTNLCVLVCRKDGINPVWVGPKFERILDEKLQENMIAFHNVSSTVVNDVPAEDGLICVLDGEVYLRVVSSRSQQGLSSGPCIMLCLHAGTGSSNRKEHVLDPRVSVAYSIGRGVPSDPDTDAKRILILDNEPDGTLADHNSHVSREQGTIYFDDSTHSWLLVHRPGASSVRYSIAGEIPVQIYPLAEGDKLELVSGASIFLGSHGVRFDIKDVPTDK